MTTWREARVQADESLTRIGVAAPSQEAMWMLEDASGMSSAELLANLDALVPERAVHTLQRMLTARSDGTPLQYVLGHWSFRGLDLLVDGRVLIPRPETEWVVECALEALPGHGVPRGTRNVWSGTDTQHVIADLGTGSGAIAIALAAELPTAQIWATDVSADALSVACANIAGCAATRVQLAEGSWFSALPDTLHHGLCCVISNPPYIGASEWESLDHEVRDYEPFSALVGGPDGFEAIAEIIEEAPQWLTPAGILIIELAPGQDERAQHHARAAGFATATIAPDLTGRARALIATMNTEDSQRTP